MRPSRRSIRAWCASRCWRGATVCTRVWAALHAALADQQAAQDSAHLAAVAARDRVAADWTVRERALLATRDSLQVARGAAEGLATAVVAEELRRARGAVAHGADA